MMAKRDWGWVDLLTPAEAVMRARGHLFAVDVDADGNWRGELESLHLTPPEDALLPGRYLARFERGHEYHDVHVTVAEDTVHVLGDDAALPAVALELAEGE